MLWFFSFHIPLFCILSLQNYEGLLPWLVSLITSTPPKEETDTFSALYSRSKCLLTQIYAQVLQTQKQVQFVHD